MALQASGTISLANVQTEFGGVNPISISEYYGKAAGIPASGTISLSHFYGKSNGVLTLLEVVFNDSGTFTVPSNAINNTFYVGCTGGGGASMSIARNNEYYGGGGSGRTSGTFTLTPNSQIAVTVGAGSITSNGAGGTSSFGGYVSCAGASTRIGSNGGGVSGGGNGGLKSAGGASNCPAMFTLQTGAVDNTNKFYTAKSYAGGPGGTSAAGGGGGCYGAGSAQNGTATPNSGAGAGSPYGKSGSGKVVIYYYAMV